MATQPAARLTEEAYLAIDRAAEYKCEFVDGEIYAMSGGSYRHSDIAGAINAEFRLKLKGRKCRIFNSDVRVRSVKGSSYFYPDLSIVCGEIQSYKDANDILTNPIVIVEVLSPSTSDYDHGKKFAHYKEIPTLRDYLLVHTDEILVEQFTRQPNGNWLLSEHRGMDGGLMISSVDCHLTLRSIYEDAFGG